jgi:hypothetical protein
MFEEERLADKNTAEKQRAHLKKVAENLGQDLQPCLHDGCPECLGTGIKLDGSSCIHMLNCLCPKCTPRYGR